MSAAIGLAVAGIGALVIGIAGIGVLRLPDVFARLHAATKAGTLGALLMLSGASLVSGVGETWLIAGITIVVLLATLPLSAQMLARAAYLSGADITPLAEPDPLAAEIDPAAEPQDRPRR